MAVGSQSSQTDARLREFADLEVRSWHDIHDALNELPPAGRSVEHPALIERAARGIAFLTFAYGIDGVSMEIAKYAACLETLLGRVGSTPTIHCIGGHFSASAAHVLLPRWHRHVIQEANGWSKWHGGRYFERLFRADMPAGSEASAEMAGEIWRQAVGFARELVHYLTSREVGLLLPVNVNSNPGNPALALAVVLASELMDLPVLNSNHDFYWESGKPDGQRSEGEKPGTRDHFFRNHANTGFFTLLERIFPWNGERWLQLVINGVQQDTLLARHRFPETKVIELGTFIEDDFFVPCGRERRRDLRTRLSRILGRGGLGTRLTRLDSFAEQLDDWMLDQVPVVCAAGDDARCAAGDEHALWFLQPTRVLTRKRIERDWELIRTLLEYGPFRTAFEANPEATLTLHVTGPVPLEHRDDLRLILDAYRRTLEAVAPALRPRLFQLFSAGHLGHSSFQEHSPHNLTVADLYHLSDLVLLPSATEGRGLPILESAAAGRPLVCSRYEPREVFADVIGEALAPDLRIHYAALPEEHINTALLQEVTDMVFLPENDGGRRLHNRRALAGRYGMRDVVHTFADSLNRLKRGSATS